MNAKERRRMHTHERTRMGTDADIHTRTRTYEDGCGRIMGFKQTDMHVREQTHTSARRMYGRTGEKNTPYMYVVG